MKVGYWKMRGGKYTGPEIVARVLATDAPGPFPVFGYTFNRKVNDWYEAEQWTAKGSLWEDEKTSDYDLVEFIGETLP